MDLSSKIIWADVVDSDSDDYSTLDSGLDGSQPNALEVWIKSFEQEPAKSHVSSLPVTLKENQREQIVDNSSRFTPTTAEFEENDNLYSSEHDTLEDRVPVSPQFSRDSSSAPRLPKSKFSPTRMLVLASEQDQKINIAEGAVRQQQRTRTETPRDTTGRRRNQALDKLESELDKIKATQKDINIALRALKLNPSQGLDNSTARHQCHHRSDSTPRSLGDRVDFDRCSQLLDETFEDFYRRLCKVAAKAQLCSCCADQRIAARIALGIRNRVFSKELMELSPFPTVKQVVEICRANETIDRLMNRTPCAGCGQVNCFLFLLIFK